MKLVSDLYNKLASFKKNEKGSIIPLAAISITALALAGGAAVDYARYASTKSLMDTALDAAILDAGKRLGAGQPVDQKFEDDFITFFNVNITGRGGFTDNYEIVNFSADADTGKVSASAKAVVDATLMRIGGFDKLNAVSNSGGIFEQNETEVTIMLDSTGSMEQFLPGTSTTRLDALKSAATEAVEILLPDGRNTRNMRIGLVPYGSSVNVGTRRARMVTYNNDQVQVAGLQNFVYPGNNVDPFNGCVTERGGREASTDAFYTTAPIGSDKRSIEGKTSRDRYTCPELEVRPLTNEISLLKQDISNLDNDGFTGGHLGVAWSYYMLSNKWERAWPNNAAKPYSPDVNKVAILMTDGEFNTAYDGVNGRPFGTQGTKSSNLAEDLCDNMKAAKNGNPGIIVYSIAFAAPAQAERTLRNCANAPTASKTFFFSASNEEELRDAFKKIAEDITSLRLTQ